MRPRTSRGGIVIALCLESSKEVREPILGDETAGGRGRHRGLLVVVVILLLLL